MIIIILTTIAIIVLSVCDACWIIKRVYMPYMIPRDVVPGPRWYPPSQPPAYALPAAKPHATCILPTCYV